ncbi:protein RRP5 homolog [Asterias rubens]|uniref:protein RRP5 homolog n=1 Tax=Asterias rubens TaxID=7604 RepID=UPI001455A93D|nr:protein RRP5 homolog [Asterias rubens]
MEEEDFPRGRGNQKKVTFLETKSIKRKHEDALFKDDSETSNLEKRRRESKVTIIEEDKDDDEDESPLKMFEYDEGDENIEEGAEGVIEDGLLSTSEIVPKFSKLRRTTISEGLLVLGAIKELHEYEIVVNLPSMMTGYVQITDISASYTKLLEKLGDAQMERMDEVQGIPNLQDLYSIGELVLCKVKSAGTTKSGRQHIQLTLDPQAINSQLSPSMLQSGMTVVGSISSKEDHGYVIETGVAGVHGFLNNSDAEWYMKNSKQEQPLFVSKPIKCQIKEVKSNGRSLVLSTNPAAFSRAKIRKQDRAPKLPVKRHFSSLLPGAIVNATVTKVIEENIKVSFLNSFTGCIDQFHLKDSSAGTSLYKEKQMVKACIIFSCPNSKSLGLSLMLQHVDPVNQTQSQLQDLKIGEIIKHSTILRIDKRLGMLVQLHEESRGFVYLPHLSDKKDKITTQGFKVGGIVKVRVLDINLMDKLASVSMKVSILKQPFLGYYDIQPGAKVEGTVSAVTDKGLRIQISPHVAGFVPNLHMADVIIHKPSSKFQIDQALQLRVLVVDANKRRLLLTHKKSLVESTLPVITSYDQPEVDMLLHAYIVTIKDFGYLVRFYNDVTGLIHSSELCIGNEAVEEGAYAVGQVVKCRVTKTYPVEDRRISLSLNLTKKPTEIKEAGYSNPEMGQLTDAKVTRVTDYGLDVTLQPGGARAFLPKMHLSDFTENCGPMLACYERNDIISNVMHWSFSTRTNHAVVTQKPMLIQAKQNKELIKEFNELQSDAVVMGVVKRVMKYGLFIELPNNLVGLAPISAMSDDFTTNSDAFQVGQTLRANVTEVVVEKSRFLLSLQSSMCHPKKGEDRLLMEQYFNERDVISKKLATKEAWKQLLKPKICQQVEVEVSQTTPVGLVCQLPNDVNGFIDSSYIGENEAEEGSKVSAYVLNVDLKEKFVELCLDPRTIHLDVKVSQQQLSKKSKNSDVAEATVAMVKDDFVMVCLNSSGRIAYIPGRRHLNDIRVGDDCLAVGQTINVIKQRFINNRVFTEQFVSQKKNTTKPSAPQTVEKAVPKKTSKKELKNQAKKEPKKESRKERKMKTESADINAEGLQLGQTVTAVVKSILECQMNVRVNDVIMGRVHALEVRHFMKPTKSPFKGMKVGQELKAKVIGYLQVKDHHYLPITHTHGVKMAVDLTLIQSKLDDDDFKTEDLTLEKQLLSYKPEQTVTCVVQKYVQNVLWVAVTGTLQGKIFQLNLSKSLSEVQKPAKLFKPGAVRKAKVVKIDMTHKVLELTFVGTGSSELTPGMILNGFITRIIPGVGLVIQLPFCHHGRVSLTDLRDRFIKDPLAGFKKKQCVRCCVMAVPKKDNAVLSLRASDTWEDHAAVIDKDIRSAEELAVGDIVKGYVSSCTKVGVFVSLSRKVFGRIQMKNLSESFVKDPGPLFPTGMLLTVAVLSVNKKSGKIELSSASTATGAEDPVPAKLRVTRKKNLKRKRNISEGEEDIDSGLEEPETLSDTEVEVIQKPREGAPVARLNVDSGFSWDSSHAPDAKKSKKTVLRNEEESSSEESDVEEEETVVKEPSQVKSKKEKEAIEKAEEELLFKTECELMDEDKTPQTSDEYDRLVLSSPNSSLVWIRYMAFYLQSAEIDKARAVAERALKTMSFREESEKLNVWVSFLNLENLYGTEESLLKVFERALKHCEPIKVFQNMVNIYVRTEKLEQAEQLYNTMVKRFNFNKDVWISYGYFLMKSGRHGAAHKLMQRSFKSLTQKEHVDVITKFAQMEFKFAEAERGKTMFENVLSNYPKRTDIWSVYLDMMIKEADVEAVRHLFERVIHLSLSAKKMKFFFKRYLEFEKKSGTDASVVEVKRKAVEYVESKMEVVADS